MQAKHGRILSSLLVPRRSVYVLRCVQNAYNIEMELYIDTQIQIDNASCFLHLFVYNNIEKIDRSVYILNFYSGISGFLWANISEG